MAQPQRSRRKVPAAELVHTSPAERLERLLVDEDVALFYPPEYGRAIWDAVHEVRPTVMIEFGVHHGYTAIVAALAMEQLGHGQLKAYDRWEDDRAAGTTAAAQTAHAHLEKYGVSHRIRLADCDFFEWVRAPEPCQLFYFDIDNTGDKVLAMYRGLERWLRAGGVVLLEGGSEARDQHPSMVNSIPIRSAKEETGYRVVVDAFPSLSRISGTR